MNITATSEHRYRAATLAKIAAAAAYLLLPLSCGDSGKGTELTGSTPQASSGSCPVTITIPGQNESVGQYIQISVNQSCSNWTNAMRAYIDNVDCSSNSYAYPNSGCFTTGGAQNFSSSTWVEVTSGSHTIVVNNWDSSGDVSVSNGVNFTYNGGGSSSGSGSGSSSSGGGGGGSLPTPPSNATVFSNIQNVALSGQCNASSCAGGSGSGSYSSHPGQSSPSLSGSSLEVEIQGSKENALFWWHNSTSQSLASSVSNFLEDFYMYTDGTSGVQALEYDPDLYLNGYKNDMSIQCDYADGNLWRLWNSAGNAWEAVSPKLPCSFSVNTWHHIQLYVTFKISNYSYTYKVLCVDGTCTNLNAPYSGLKNGWGPDIGTEVQLDGNATGNAVHEWIDKMTLTVW